MSVIGNIEKRVKGGRATSEDFLKLAELNARGLPVQDLIAQAAQTKSSPSWTGFFFAKVEEDAEKGTFTPQNFSAIAVLAANGSSEALKILRKLREAFSVNEAIFDWALSAAQGSKVVVDDTMDGELLEFYQLYIDSPNKIERTIPPDMGQALKSTGLTDDGESDAGWGDIEVEEVEELEGLFSLEEFDALVRSERDSNSLADSFEEVSHKEDEEASVNSFIAGQGQNDLLSDLASSVFDPLNQRSSGEWSSLPTLKLDSPTFVQRIFGIVGKESIAGKVEGFANEKVNSKAEWIKQQGKAIFGKFLEDPKAELAKKLKPIDLLADQDSAKALLELIGKDQHEPLIGLLTEIDGWINEMKVGADRTRDKAAIEKAAVDVLGDRLGDLLFGNGEAVKAKVGLRKR